MPGIFPILILNGRPAAGKSEIIDYLKGIPVDERIRRFHIGEFEEFDDFPILWERFEDDDLFEKYGKPRLISNTTFEFDGETLPGYTFKDPAWGGPPRLDAETPDDKVVDAVLATLRSRS